MLRGLQGSKGRVSRLKAKIRGGMKRLRPLSERRRFGRLKGGSLGCNRGRVMDLSGGGLRLRTTRRLSSKMSFDLWTAMRRVTVRGEIVWIRRLGFRNYEVGVQFYDVTPEITETLTAFAAFLRAG